MNQQELIDDLAEVQKTMLEALQKMGDMQLAGDKSLLNLINSVVDRILALEEKIDKIELQLMPRRNKTN